VEGWLTRMERIGALWRHDGNPKRPYPQLTSGLIADTYCECEKLFAHRALFQEAVESLISEMRQKEGFPRDDRRIVFAPREGGKKLADEIARQLSCASIGARWAGADKKTMILDDGAEKVLQPATAVIAGDDILSTGLSLSAALQALRARAPVGMRCKIPLIYCIGNFYEYPIFEGLSIASLFTIGVRRWKRGENPYTADGQERVAPVRPEGNWDALVREYP